LTKIKRRKFQESVRKGRSGTHKFFSW